MTHEYSLFGSNQSICNYHNFCLELGLLCDKNWAKKNFSLTSRSSIEALQVFKNSCYLELDKPMVKPLSCLEITNYETGHFPF